MRRPEAVENVNVVGPSVPAQSLAELAREVLVRAARREEVPRRLVEALARGAILAGVRPDLGLQLLEAGEGEGTGALAVVLAVGVVGR